MSDHVFRDVGGRLEFVGDFEALYSQEVDPWEQSAKGGDMATYYMHSRMRLARSLRARFPTQGVRGIEVGCGHGHVTQMLHALMPRALWGGIDVSSKAVEGARERYPGLLFEVADITRTETLHGFNRSQNIVLLNQVLWYVLDRMDHTVANCLSMIKGDGLLIISQAFLRDQRYGREIADGFQGALKLLDRYSEWLSLIECSYDDSAETRCLDGLMVYRKLP